MYLLKLEKGQMSEESFKTKQLANNGDHKQKWIAENIDRFKDLLDKRPTDCPVCYESFNEKEAITLLLNDIPSKCTHWLCNECWEKVASSNAECPFCREDLRTWLL